MLRRDAEPFWARLESVLSRDDVDSPVCRMAISDITETRQAEQEARDQKEILGKVFESSPYIMMLVEQAIQVTKINRVCADFSGRSKDEAIGLLGGEVFRCLNSLDETGCGKNVQCSDCSVRNNVMHTFQTGESIHDAEGTLTIRKGSAEIQVDVILSTTLIKDEG